MASSELLRVDVRIPRIVLEEPLRRGGGPVTVGARAGHPRAASLALA